MAVRVDEEVAGDIAEDPGGIRLQVRTQDAAAAGEALQAASREVLALDGGWQSSPGLQPGDVNTPTFASVQPHPRGPVLVVDGGHTPTELLATIPDILVRHLHQQGVGEAEITTAVRSGPLIDHHPTTVRRAVVLWLYPIPVAYNRSAPVPATWRQAAAAWVTDELASHARVEARADTEFFALPAGETADFVAGAHAHSGGLMLIAAGDYPDRFRALSGELAGRRQVLAVAGGGQGCSDADQLAVFDELVALARRLVDDQLGWAGITFDLTFAALSRPMLKSTWRDLPLLSDEDAPTEAAVRLADEVAPDACPYQVLSPRHLARLGEPPAASQPLAAGHSEVWLGEPADWIPASDPEDADRPGNFWQGDDRRRDPQVARRAREALAPLLVTSERDLHAISAARFGDPFRHEP
jgi:hypothetical protein